MKDSQELTATLEINGCDYCGNYIELGQPVFIMDNDGWMPIDYICSSCYEGTLNP